MSGTGLIKALSVDTKASGGLVRGGTCVQQNARIAIT
jgi:hypothetical protein